MRRIPAAPDAPPPVRDITITEAEFRTFSEFFHRRTGIHFDEGKRYFVDRRLVERIQATGAETFRRYFIGLRFATDDAELQRLVNLMTVNETYFFRETHQFDCMVEHLLDEIVRLKPPGERIRIWSVPSSTGEEPYTIAMVLLERWAKLPEHEVEILSSDIDTRVLEHAERGVFSSRSVAQMPPYCLARYFERRGEDEWAITRDLVDAVSFSRVNLSDPRETRTFRNIDLVFCRNLLIYFDDVSRRLAAENLFDAMRPGAFLCLGHSESMSRISSMFDVRRFPGALVYQKPPTGDAR